MFRYQTPLRDMQFVLHELLDTSAEVQRFGESSPWDADTIDRALESVGRFAELELAPLNASGDEEGCRIVDGKVSTPRGFAQAYRRFVDAGWPTLNCAEDVGGQGAPSVVFTAMNELLNAANPGWNMYFGTAHGAYECLQAHATAQQKEDFLLKIVSGEWTATMCLTEAHSGSDLGMLRTRAAGHPDGSYRITGSKIFISGGDQDITPNIVHLVLARVPDAPPGVAGVSLFIVPKFLRGADGSWNCPNAVTASAVEHKMGLRGSATCAMEFEQSVGWLVGRPNEGLRNMFVMMNSMRVGVAVQAVGMAQAAYCSALHYARERLQMRAAGGARRPDLPADPIIEHADVRRMLLTQKAHVEAARMLAYWLSLLLDREQGARDEATRRESSDLASLLTPVAKAFLTENAFLVTNLAVQIHGGHGYIRDHGVEQIVRDVRIGQIYEGTTGIQARDLLARKVLADAGAKLNAFLDIIRRELTTGAAAGLPGEFRQPLLRLCDDLNATRLHVADAARAHPDEVGAAGWDFLRALGHLTCGWLYARAAAVSTRRLGEGASDPIYAAKLATARFYVERILPEAFTHLAVARTGNASLSSLTQEQLFV